MSVQLLQTIAGRRSIYNLGNKLPKAKPEITKLIKDTVRILPSSFNIQSSRVVILYGDESQKVWQSVKDAMTALKLPEEQLKASFAKVDGCFASGAGTVLFYEDMAAIKSQQDQFPAYAANFPIWSQHSSAIAQFAVWTALSTESVGASLQHYNELIEDRLRAQFDIPADWKLIAQMPFGSIEKPADAKTTIEDEKRFIVRGE